MDNKSSITKELRVKRFAVVEQFLEAINEINSGPLLRHDKYERVVFLAYEIIRVDQGAAD